MTRFEVTRLISARALQLSLGAPSMVKAKGNNPVEIAKQEFKEKVIPLSVLREFPDGTVEKVDVA